MKRFLVFLVLIMAFSVSSKSFAGYDTKGMKFWDVNLSVEEELKKAKFRLSGEEWVDICIEKGGMKKGLNETVDFSYDYQIPKKCRTTVGHRDFFFDNSGKRAGVIIAVHFKEKGKDTLAYYFRQDVASAPEAPKEEKSASSKDENGKEEKKEEKSDKNSDLLKALLDKGDARANAIVNLSSRSDAEEILSSAKKGSGKVMIFANVQGKHFIGVEDKEGSFFFFDSMAPNDQISPLFTISKEEVEFLIAKKEAEEAAKKKTVYTEFTVTYLTHSSIDSAETTKMEKISGTIEDLKFDKDGAVMEVRRKGADKPIQVPFCDMNEASSNKHSEDAGKINAFKAKICK